MILPAYKRVPELIDARLEQGYLDRHAKIYPSIAEDDFRAARGLKGMMGWFGGLLQVEVPDGIVIDVGCGAGGFTYQLSKVFPESSVIGIDNSHKAIDCAKANYRNISNLEFKVGDVLNLSAYQNAARAVTCVDALHHFNDLEGAVRNVSLSLKKHGFFLVHDFNRSEMDAKFIMACAHYFRMIRETGEQGLHSFLEKHNAFSGTQAIETASVLSKMAAYAVHEVKDELHNEGFAVKTSLAPDSLFLMHAIKLCDARLLAFCEEAGL